MIELRPASQRGISNLGWLYSKHTFSFSSYQDPQHIGFSDLLVINDDIVTPGMGFGTHPHRDMEIFSYVLEGGLAHQDSMDQSTVIHPGDVQMMSAGTGIRHSEYNASDKEQVHFLQIWIVPDRVGVEPRYDQKHFSAAEKRGKFRLIISPKGEAGSLPVYQDTCVYAGLFDGSEEQTLTLADNRYAYVHVARGSIDVNGQTLRFGDGAKFRNVKELSFSKGHQAEVLLFDLRPNELPAYYR
jgi:redox-sensitive bicupin YhaK (pirin superfamily)